MIKTKDKNIEISLHILVWLVLFFLPVAFSIGSDTDWKGLFVHFWLHMFFLAILFYSNYFFLIHRILKKNKLLFIGVNLILILALVFTKNQIFDWLEGDHPRPEGRKPPTMLVYFMDTLIYTIPVAFSIAIRAGQKIQRAEELKTEADNIKLQSELQLLKYQLQPHFFFNALNNIYSMIDFDPEKAKQSIHSLSKLMRHLLYKTDVDQINLKEEVEFLNKYIELMTLRLNDNTKVYTSFPPTIPDLKIAPLLLISIVENAFKHGVSATQHSDIHFKMDIHENEILFTASNTNYPKSDVDKSGSGIGMENLKKRLLLLYPKNHELHAHLHNGIYIAELKITT